MRRTRFMSWIFLVLSLAFFRVHDFRAALEAPLISLLPDYSKVVAPEVYGNPGPLGGLWKLYTLDRYVSAAQLDRMAQEAELRGDSQFMAFAALHLPAKEQGDHVFRFADRAVAMDPKLTWLYVCLLDRFHDEVGTADLAKQVGARIDKLLAWDADNSVPYLLRAQLIRVSAGKGWTAVSKDPARIRALLEQHLEWQREMKRAFARPRYETYALQRFALERKIMREHGWDHPLVLLMETGKIGYPVFDTREYATNILVLGIGAHAEAMGEVEKALNNYRQAARFGEIMRLQGHTYIEQLLGMANQRSAYLLMVPALEKAGQKSEAATIDYANKQALNELNVHWKDPLDQTSNYGWAALVMSLFAGLVWVFFLASLVSVTYVNAKRWIRREKKGRLYQVMTVGENYAPLLLFISSLVVALSYAPYAQNYSDYMDQAELSGKLNLWENIFPNFGMLYRPNLPLQDPYPGYFSFVLVSFLLLGLVALLGSLRVDINKKMSGDATSLAPPKGTFWRYTAVVAMVLAIGLVLWVENGPRVAPPTGRTGSIDSSGAPKALTENRANGALADAQKALDLYRAKRDESSAKEVKWRASDLLDMGFYFENQGNRSEARKMDEQALAMSRELGDDSLIAASLTQFASVLRYSGDLARARKLFEEALTLDCKSDDEDEAKFVLNQLADVLKSSGDKRRSGEIYQWALRIYGQEERANATKWALTFAGAILASQDDYAEAQSMYERAIALCRSNCDPDEVASIQYSIFGLYDSQARDLELAWDFAGARKVYELSLARSRKVGDQDGIAYARDSIENLPESEKVWADVKTLRDPFRPIP
jgi:tetratricopeptide (TPR) repeat protein